MNRKKFVERYSAFVQFIMKLAQGAKRCGITSLEDEIWDIEEKEQVFKEGLRLIVAGTNPATVNEILTNMTEHEKDKYMRLYKTIQKRAALGLQAGESVFVLYKALSSLAGLPLNEEHKIELSLLSEEADPEPGTTENEGETELSPFDEAIFSLNDNTMKTVVKEFSAEVLANALIPATKKIRERFYSHMSKRQASMLQEDIDYIRIDNESESENAQQTILAFLQNLTD